MVVVAAAALTLGIGVLSIYRQVLAYQMKRRHAARLDREALEAWERRKAKLK